MRKLVFSLVILIIPSLKAMEIAEPFTKKLRIDNPTQANFDSNNCSDLPQDLMKYVASFFVTNGTLQEKIFFMKVLCSLACVNKSWNTVIDQLLAKDESESTPIRQDQFYSKEVAASVATGIDQLANEAKKQEILDKRVIARLIGNKKAEEWCSAHPYDEKLTRLLMKEIQGLVIIINMPKIRELIETGANVNGHMQGNFYDSSFSKDWMPLMVAVHQNANFSEDTMKLLLANGADINARNNGVVVDEIIWDDIAGTNEVRRQKIKGGQEAALMHAVTNYHPRMYTNIEFLLQHGADISVPNSKGQTVFDIAKLKAVTGTVLAVNPWIGGQPTEQKYGNPELLELLEKYRDNSHHTAR